MFMCTDNLIVICTDNLINISPAADPPPFTGQDTGGGGSSCRLGSQLLACYHCATGPRELPRGTTRWKERGRRNPPLYAITRSKSSSDMSYPTAVREFRVDSVSFTIHPNGIWNTVHPFNRHATRKLDFVSDNHGCLNSVHAVCIEICIFLCVFLFLPHIFRLYFICFC